MNHWIIVTILLVTVLASPSAWGQVAPPAGESKEVETHPELAGAAVRDRATMRQVEKLKMSMKTLADAIEKTEPAAAAALKLAAEEIDIRKLTDSLQAAIADMENNLAGDAAIRHATIIQDMKAVLDKIRNVDGPNKKDIDAWKQMLKDLEGLIVEQKQQIDKQHVANNAKDLKDKLDNAMRELKEIAAEQQKLLDETGKLGEGDPALKKLGEIKEQLDKIIEKQTQLREGTDRDEIGRLAFNGEQQRDLGKLSEELAATMAEAAKDPAVTEALEKSGGDPKAAQAASQSTKSAAGNMKAAADNLSKSTSASANAAADDQDAALHNLKKAQQAIADAMAKTGGNTPADAVATKQDELKDRLDAVNKDVKDVSAQSGQSHDTSRTEGAAGDMAKASESLKGQNTQSAKGHQQEALKKLTEDELRKLAELSRKIEEMAKVDPENTKKQEEIAQGAQELADRMSQKTETSPNGAPGKENMDSASRSARSAAGKMSQGGGSGGPSGEKDQKDAKDEMEKAREKLAQEIAKAEQQQQEQAIARIIDLLGKMLHSQKSVSAETRNLDGKQADGQEWSRAEELALAKLSSEEGRLGDEAVKIIKMLTDEGTTAVFPQVLKQVEVDLRDVQNMLGDKQTGQLTQAIQSQIEKNLQGMIDALKQEQQRRKQQGGGGGGGGGGGQAPLVPPVAELKMLKSLQLDINARTETVATVKEKNLLPAEQVKTQHERLSGKQKEVENMAIELKGKMQQQPGGPQ
ncbi:MAG: DUF4175 family protein [Phycisphaerae bacterium]|nr:DUF4175 family protein [Phycisphaerae bacterium]